MTFDRPAFFTATRAHFGALKQDQVDGFNAVIDTFEKSGGSDPRHLAYMLATCWHETACTMQPIREYGRGAGRKYGRPVNGKVYYGRGFVQLTWDYNYRKAGEKLGVDLLGNPDKALDLAIAGQILHRGMIEGWFTGKRLSQYFSARTDDPVGARRIINGTDKAALIAGHHRAFMAALRAALISAPSKETPKITAPPPPPPKGEVVAPAQPAPQKAGFFTRVVRALTRKAA